MISQMRMPLNLFVILVVSERHSYNMKNSLMIKYYIYLFFAIILTAIVQAILKIISMKYDGNILASILNPWLYFSLLLLIVAFITWFVSASKIEFSILIPVSVTTIIIGALIGYFFFGEEFGGKKL